MTPRLHVPDLVPGRTPTLRGDQINYLRNVLRLGPRDRVRLFCGDGLDHEYEILTLTRHEVELGFIATASLKADPRLSITLIQAFLKGEKVDELIRDTTALGVSAIRLCGSSRAIGRPSESRLDRWRRIAEEASRQCGRTTIPRIEIPAQLDIRDILAETRAEEGRMRVLFWEGEGERMERILSPDCEVSDLVFAVGPEGGWSDVEVSCAEDYGWQVIRLGNRILRADLFPVVALVAMQERLGLL